MPRTRFRFRPQTAHRCTSRNRYCPNSPHQAARAAGRARFISSAAICQLAIRVANSRRALARQDPRPLVPRVTLAPPSARRGRHAGHRPQVRPKRLQRGCGLRRATLANFRRRLPESTTARPPGGRFLPLTPRWNAPGVAVAMTAAAWNGRHCRGTMPQPNHGRLSPSSAWRWTPRRECDGSGP